MIDRRIIVHPMLVVNVKTASALKLTVPHSLFARANRVPE